MVLSKLELTKLKVEDASCPKGRKMKMEKKRLKIREFNLE